MKLNAEILFHEISRVFPAEMTGYKSDELITGRPEFYLDENVPFLAGHLYVMAGERISRRVPAEKGAVILCTGTAPQMSYFLERCCFIRIRGNADLLRLFNLLQTIFDRYDSWSDSLSEILESTASVEEMAEKTLSIFDNPILILDSSFHVIAHCGLDMLQNQPLDFDLLESGALSVSSLEKYLSQRDLMLYERGPLSLTTLGFHSLSMNLFDGEEYAGSITIEYFHSGQRSGDNALIAYFAQWVTLAIRRNSSVITSERSVLRRVLQNIINGMPVDTAHRKYLDNMKVTKRFVCTLLQLRNRYAQIPVDYVCSKFDSVFPGSITFENRANIISFIETDPLETESGYEAELLRRIDLLVGTMDLKVGLSTPFTDPYSARQYYSQAKAALENGLLFHPEATCYNFDDYALTELILNAQSDLPLDMYFSDGLRSLLDHDREAPISYIETLRVYLSQNMNVTRTAAELFIHRSTLLERLSRIERELGEDLDDPDVRLRLQILLKALEMQDTVQKHTS